jgi:hypothetical protein
MREMLARYLTPEQIQQQTAGYFSGALEQAGMVGERAGAAGSQLAGTLSALGGALPGMDPNQVALMLRGTQRAGASAQLMGETLGGQARLAQALATSGAMSRRDERMQQLELEALGKEEEAGRIEADVLTPAGQMQALAGGALQNRMLRNQLRNAPLERKALILQNAAAEGQITAQSLQNAAFVRELKNQGFKVSKKGGRTVLTGEDGTEIPIPAAINR